MIWKTHNREFDLSRRAVVMGILNLTHDSFSDGGRFLHPDAAVEHALRMEAEGAEIIDIGGESTRPGAEPVPEAEELARVLPVVQRLRGTLKAALSIDTSKAAVAQAALENGAEIINDITALRGDPAMAGVVARSGAGLILMHMQGTPRTMQQAPHYEEVIAEVRVFFHERGEAALASGIAPEAIVFDPGIGFGKRVEDNLALLQRLGELSIAIGSDPISKPRPLLVGASRKSFIGTLLHEPLPERRLWPTVAITCLTRERGARLFRVHDVTPNLEALRMTEAFLPAC